MPTLNVDLTGIEYSTNGGGGWNAFPAGEYRMMVTGAELKATAAGNGTRLAVEFSIVGGEHAGKSHWESFNVVNPNPTAVKIAQEQLANLADACGLPRDFLKTIGSEALESKVVVAELTRTKARDARYGDANGFENKVRAYAAAATASPTPSAAQAPVEAPPMAADDIPF